MAPVVRVGRFIPTGVGNTWVPNIIGLMDSVHPHGRGEHAEQARDSLLKGGSSPRAWGTL